ncbi:MAG: CRTAC1 family protein [Acidobacteriota bacterium]
MRHYAAIGLAAALVLGPCAVLPHPAFASEPVPPASGGWTFVDVSAPSGLSTEFLYLADKKPIEPRWICGGAAAGDLDRDGYTDFFFVGGELGADALYRNLGDGTFQDITDAAGVDLNGRLGCGPVFVDLDGDGHDDLMIPSVEGEPEHPGQPAVDVPGAYPKIFMGGASGTFTEASSEVGFQAPFPGYSAAFADVDGDGDLDGFVSRWRHAVDALFWRQDDGVFTEATEAFFGPDPGQRFLYSFTPNFTDLDNDGRLDLAVAGDFGNSRVLLNRGEAGFLDVTSPVIDDENGMGSTVGDIDNDGDIDWFVSSIWDPDGMPDGGNWGVSGNRLYRNLGDGTFEDITDLAGVRRGYWGWGSCFADFDNDRDLDLFHVNGFNALGASEFFTDPARLFLNDGTGVFTESSAVLGAADTGQGRGVVCFDLERDGDIDILIAQNGQPPTLLRNDLPAGAHSLTVQLAGHAPNPRGIGARLTVTLGDLEQIREIRAGSNFISQDPAEAHFGLADATSAEVLTIRWPDGRLSKRGQVPAQARLIVPVSDVFSDGFESGSTSAWSAVSGAAPTP